MIIFHLTAYSVYSRFIVFFNGHLIKFLKNQVNKIITSAWSEQWDYISKMIIWLLKSHSYLTLQNIFTSTSSFHRSTNKDMRLIFSTEWNKNAFSWLWLLKNELSVCVLFQDWWSMITCVQAAYRLFPIGVISKVF